MWENVERVKRGKNSAVATHLLQIHADPAHEVQFSQRLADV
jgi:hypothetical protein